MEAIRYCTLIGLGESTNLSEVARIARANPIAEWGVLFDQSKATQGNADCYPGAQWIKDFTREAQQKQLHTLIHLGEVETLAFLRCDEAVMGIACEFGRVQLSINGDSNGFTPDLPLEKIRQFIHRFHLDTDTRVILPNNRANGELCMALRTTSGLDVLFDSPDAAPPTRWPRLLHYPAMRSGFSGGLNAENIKDELVKIAQAHCGKPYWISLCKGLRDQDDKFNLDTCRTVLQDVGAFVMKSMIEDVNKWIDSQGQGSPTQVSELDGFWLDWWTGLAGGYAMAVPSTDIIRSRHLDRKEGKFSGFAPTQHAPDAADALDHTDIGCIKENGQWQGVTPTGARVPGLSRQQAMLRGLVLNTFGDTLTKNPAHHPEFHRHWVGPTMTQTHLPKLISGKMKIGAKL